MKTHAIFVGITGALLLTAVAGSAALAQARFYPDGTNCSQLSDAELVACQNQIYARQMESGMSQQETPAAVPSSHIEGTEASKPDFVPGAEGTAPPSAWNTPAETPTVIYKALPGPEGTIRVNGPTE